MRATATRSIPIQEGRDELAFKCTDLDKPYEPHTAGDSGRRSRWSTGSNTSHCGCRNFELVDGERTTRRAESGLSPRFERRFHPLPRNRARHAWVRRTMLTIV